MQKIKTVSGKSIKLPARIFTKKELENMNLSYVEGAVFLNKAKSNQDFESVSDEIKKNMAIINYHDCSAIPFSEDVLKDSIEKQIKADGDFIILPYFRKENDLDVKTKLDYASQLKLQTIKEIILEVSYMVGIPPKELLDLSFNFDYLSIFYGVSYGRYPSFLKISKRIITFKASTGKKILCMATPMKFAGETGEDCRLMPCFVMVSDMWSKNWRKGGGNNKIKLTDPKDLKSKDYTGWLESGYLSNTPIAIINNRTVYDLFSKDSKLLREEFETYILDAVLNEIQNLSPENIEDYIYQKFHPIYFIPLIVAYNEKIISNLITNNELFKKYPSDNLILLENMVRRHVSSKKVFLLAQELIELVKKDSEIPIAQLIKRAENF